MQKKNKRQPPIFFFVFIINNKNFYTMKFKNLFIIFFMIVGLKVNAQNYLYVWKPSFVENNIKEEIWELNKKILPKTDSSHHHHSPTNATIPASIPDLTFHIMDVKGIYFKLINFNITNSFHIKINSKNEIKNYEIKDFIKMKNEEYYLDLSIYNGTYIDVTFIINKAPKNNVKLIIRKDYV